MLISLSFNFVGFLLTYLLHTTHAAKYGSRAGLGVTLLQYGFALRNREMGGGPGQAGEWGAWEDGSQPAPTPSEPNLDGASSGTNDTVPVSGGTDEFGNGGVPYPQEWIAFLLMDCMLLLFILFDAHFDPSVLTLL